jgi:hypothetical protein
MFMPGGFARNRPPRSMVGTGEAINYRESDGGDDERGEDHE